MYSSFECNPKRTQNANIFNQSVRSGHNNNFVASNMKKSDKINILGQSSSISEKDKSISNVTVKRVTSGGLKNLKFSH